VDRLIGSDNAERERTRRNLGLAQEQWRDYQARLGHDFAHGVYLEALTALRHQLEAALSETPSPDVPPTDELVAQFTALRQAHTVEAMPERPSGRRDMSLEEAVTTRMLRGREKPAPPDPDCDGEVAGATPLTPALTPATTADVEVVNAPMPRPRRLVPSHHQRGAADERQLCLW
jgi:hypothetical protein